MYLKLRWRNSYHANDDPKCIAAWVDKSQPLPARTQIASQHALAKLIPCQWGYKIYLSMPTIPARTLNVSQNLLTKALPCPSEDKKLHLNMCWQNTSQICVFVYEWFCINMSVWKCVYLSMCVCECVCVCVHEHVFVCVCVHVYICVYVCI